MKIEFLYFKDCPNHKTALRNLESALTELKIESKTEFIEVLDNQSAIKNRFLGSPSIRINGLDLEEDQNDDAEYSMRCRRYSYGTQVFGYPLTELIVDSLKSAVAEDK